MDVTGNSDRTSTAQMKEGTINITNGVIFYNADLLKDISEDIFLPYKHSESQPLNTLGRGSVFSYDLGETTVVLKHYHRGGLIGKIIHDSYLYLGLNKTRMVREFRLLAVMRERGLPVPNPVAVRVKKHALFYSGDLITEKIDSSKTLAEHLKIAPITPQLWKKIAGVIQEFHRENIYHADLNANNILINDQNEVFLIDFDKSYVRENGNWKKQNIERLLRSLRKIKNTSAVFYFTDQNEQYFLSCFQ